MTPSNSAYSSGWSSVCTASRLSAWFGDGPLGTAQDRSTPSSSSRRSQCSARAACFWTQKMLPPATTRPPKGSGVRDAVRLSR